VVESLSKTMKSLSIVGVTAECRNVDLANVSRKNYQLNTFA
jgi:hypothetical protein